MSTFITVLNERERMYTDTSLIVLDLVELKVPALFCGWMATDFDVTTALHSDQREMGGFE